MNLTVEGVQNKTLLFYDPRSRAREKARARSGKVLNTESECRKMSSGSTHFP